MPHQVPDVEEPFTQLVSGAAAGSRAQLVHDPVPVQTVELGGDGRYFQARGSRDLGGHHGVPSQRDRVQDHPALRRQVFHACLVQHGDLVEQALEVADHVAIGVQLQQQVEQDQRARVTTREVMQGADAAGVAIDDRAHLAAFLAAGLGQASQAGEQVVLGQRFQHRDLEKIVERRLAMDGGLQVGRGCAHDDDAPRLLQHPAQAPLASFRRGRGHSTPDRCCPAAAGDACPRPWPSA